MKDESKENKKSLLAICRSSEAAGGARSNCHEFFGSFCRYKKNKEKLLSPAANDNPELFQHYFNANHLGSGSLITDESGATYQTLAYAPHGEILVNDFAGDYDEPYKFTGYERDQESGLDYAHARYREPNKTIFYSTDPHWFKYPHITPYNYAGNNPIMKIDPTGEAWKPTYNENEDGNRTYTGYEWIAPENSYDKNGKLLAGLYEQAIFFSDNGTYKENGNDLGSSTATVYLADGTTTTFDACTHPSNSNKFATVPEGLYEAYVGMHNGKKSSYIALKMRDVGAKSNTIELGQSNPSNPSTTSAQGIDIHKAGRNNSTSLGVSEGCLVIDIKKWDSFISIFNNSAQSKNPVSVTVSRSLASPTNQIVIQQKPAFNFIFNGRFSDYIKPFKIQ